MGAPAWVSALSSNYSSDGALDFACHCFSAAAALLPLSMLASLQLLWLGRPSLVPVSYLHCRPNRVLTFQHGPALTEMAAESLGHSTFRNSLQVTSRVRTRAQRWQAEAWQGPSSGTGSLSLRLVLEKPSAQGAEHTKPKLAKSSWCCPTSPTAPWDWQGCRPHTAASTPPVLSKAPGTGPAHRKSTPTPGPVHQVQCWLHQYGMGCQIRIHH